MREYLVCIKRKHFHILQASFSNGKKKILPNCKIREVVNNHKSSTLSSTMSWGKLGESNETMIEFSLRGKKQMIWYLIKGKQSGTFTFGGNYIQFKQKQKVD